MSLILSPRPSPGNLGAQCWSYGFHGSGYMSFHWRGGRDLQAKP